MANISDYLQWRGDIPLEVFPFNDVDNVIMSVLSYLDFTGIVPGEQEGTGISLREACRRLLVKSGGDAAQYVRAVARIDSRLVRLIADSQRFGTARLSAYVDIIDPSRALQFAALQIDLTNGETYVSYRGTDSSLVGWREDFMLSFQVTEAQREAEAYLKGVLDRTRGRQSAVRVGGHSKGGNLAEYAAVRCVAEHRKRIACVYSNDGPGMAPEVLPFDSRKALGSRFKHFVPSYSVIGMIFARPDRRRIIVKSSGVGIGQHDLTTWQVMRSELEEAHELQPDCMVLNEAIARWSKSLSLKERERITNDMFDILASDGATSFEEIVSTPAGLQKVLQALGTTDNRTQELALALVEGTVGNTMGGAYKATLDAFDQWRHTAQVAVGDAARLLQTAGGDIRVPVSRLRPNPRLRR